MFCAVYAQEINVNFFNRHRLVYKPLNRQVIVPLCWKTLFSSSGHGFQTKVALCTSFSISNLSCSSGMSAWNLDPILIRLRRQINKNSATQRAEKTEVMLVFALFPTKLLVRWSSRKLCQGALRNSLLSVRNLSITENQSLGEKQEVQFKLSWVIIPYRQPSAD